MIKRQRRLQLGFFILTLWGALFVLGKTELSARSQFYATVEKSSSNSVNSACVLEKEAQKYLDDIYQSSPDHFRVSKPKLVFDTSDNLHVGNRIVVGKEDGKNITIYEKGFTELYGENCSEAHLERLQSTVAHEYAHHIDFNSGFIEKELGTESMEYSAEIGGEHALFELVWDKENPKATKISAKEKGEVETLKKELASI